VPLIPAIASSSGAAYLPVMPALIIRLLTLAALALMPFGMSAAAAGPAPHAAAPPAAGPCDEQGGRASDESADRPAGCSAGCPMFVADLVPTAAPLVAVGQTPAPPLAGRWLSLPPETATPPPKIV
jgi:hypothetical protein